MSMHNRVLLCALLPRLALECTVNLCIACKGFLLACKSRKIAQDPGCVHVERVLLLMGTLCASIKLKLSCTVHNNTAELQLK